MRCKHCAPRCCRRCGCLAQTVLVLALVSRCVVRGGALIGCVASGPLVSAWPARPQRRRVSSVEPPRSWRRRSGQRRQASGCRREPTWPELKEVGSGLEPGEGDPAPEGPVGGGLCSCATCRRQYLFAAAAAGGVALAGLAGSGGLRWASAARERGLVQQMRGMADYERLLQRRKAELFKRALGGLESPSVVEVGVGTGVNFPHLAAAGVRSVVGVEPNANFAPVAGEAARSAGLEFRLEAAAAEALPFASGSVDVVVATLVLCSVRGLGRALAEFRRVLRPGGRYVFTEHVAAPEGTWLRLAQGVFDPLQQVVAVGCRLTQRPLPVIQDTFGPERVAAERWDVREENGLGPLAPHFLLAPHVSGYAEK